MNAEPQSTWAKLVEQPRRFFLWLALVTLVLMALGIVVAVLFPGFNLSPGLRSVAAFVLVGLIAAFVVSFFGFFLALIPPLQPLMRWIVRRSAFLAVCLITLVALAYAVENFRGKRAWEDFKRAAEAKGEPFEVESIIPPPVPDEQNVAATPLFKELCNEFVPGWLGTNTGPRGLTNAADRLHFNLTRKVERRPDVPAAFWMSGRRTDLKAWQDYYRNPKDKPDESGNEFPVAPQPQKPAADVLLALSKYDVLLEELREACARPQSRFPIRYEDGFNALLPHLSRIKEISQFLPLRTAAELEVGQINAAAANVKLSLRMADLVREEPLLISQLVRLAQFQLAVTPLWEGLADHRWTDAQLSSFERRLKQFDFLADYQVAMRGERACRTGTIDYLRRLRNPDLLGFSGDQTGDGPDAMERIFAAVGFHLIPRGWFDQNKVSSGRLELELIMPIVDNEARQISPSNVKRLTSTMEQQFRNRSAYNWFGAMFLPSLGSASARFAQGQAAVDMARVACALERHRLAHGQYPERLDALVPQFIPKLPHDVINGQPLKYRRTDDGTFVLYSVGWNETDDGGRTVLTKNDRTLDWKQGDWVWQYPAK